MIEHYNMIFDQFPKKTIILSKSTTTYDPTSRKNISVDENIERTCIVGGYTTKDIQNGGGLINIKDKKLALTIGEFPFDIDDKFSVILSGKKYNVLDVRIDSTESVVYIQVRN